jgi:NTE family protein
MLDRDSLSIGVGQWPKIGLALSGGGARGLAHIGVIKALERESIPVQYLAGTSMGGVIAAGYAAGMSAANLEQEARDFTRPRQLLRLMDAGFPGQGLLRGNRLQEYFETRLGNRTFSDLECALALIAVDLNSRQEIVLREGPLDIALRATTAVPGLFAPVEVGAHRLVDGGLLNNLPVDAVRKLGAEFVIAIDVEADPAGDFSEKYANTGWLPNGLARTLATVEESVTLLMSRTMEARLRQYPPDMLIRPAIPPGVSLLSGYTRIDELIRAGEQAMTSAMGQLLATTRSPAHH